MQNLPTNTKKSKSKRPSHVAEVSAPPPALSFVTVTGTNTPSAAVAGRFAYPHANDRIPTRAELIDAIGRALVARGLEILAEQEREKLTERRRGAGVVGDSPSLSYPNNSTP